MKKGSLFRHRRAEGLLSTSSMVFCRLHAVDSYSLSHLLIGHLLRLIYFKPAAERGAGGVSCRNRPIKTAETPQQ